MGQHIPTFHVMWGCVHFFVAQFSFCVKTVIFNDDIWEQYSYSA